MDIKFARTSAVVHHRGGLVRIHIGEPWHADDPFVVAHPDFFADAPERVRGTVPAGRVEQATAAPGEKRNAKRG